MISIIIASVKSNLLADVRKNISETIGVEFEVISVDNSNGARSLCEIYNEGALTAKYEVLCYMHEDIKFETQDWGQVILQLFNSQPKLGVVGIAGSSYKTLTPSGWGPDSPWGDTIFSSFTQSYKWSSKNEERFIHNPGSNRLAKVICVDGMWFCTPRSIALEKRFDENLLNGFHCYDIDYCLNVGQDYDICVTFEVLINHFSEGNFDANWLSDTLALHEKWKSILPKSIFPVDINYQRNLEKKAFRNYISSMVKAKVGLADIFKVIKRYKNAYFMNSKLYFKLNYYALKYTVFKKN